LTIYIYIYIYIYRPKLNRNQTEVKCIQTTETGRILFVPAEW